MMRRAIRNRVRQLTSAWWRARGFFSATNIETFAYCNRQCAFCPNAGVSRPRERGTMDAALWRTIIDELGAMRFAGRISPHFYGEPLLDKRLPDLLEYARQRCPLATIRVNSNGDLLTEPLFRELVARGMDRIIVTNYDDRDNETARDIAARFPRQAVYRSHRDVAMANRAGVVGDADAAAADAPCKRAAERLVITWKGDVVLCCNDFYSANVFGNVSVMSIREIWNSARFRAVRRALAGPGGRRGIPLCRNCNQDVEPNRRG